MRTTTRRTALALLTLAALPGAWGAGGRRAAAEEGDGGAEECSCGPAGDGTVANSDAGRFDWAPFADWMRVVRVPGDFDTVQEAVDAAEDGEADAIVIGPGRFAENVVVPEWTPPGLWIVGEDGMDLHGTGSGPALTVAAADVFLQGLTVTSAGDGILALSSSVRMRFVSVRDCGGDGVRFETGVDDDARIRRTESLANGFQETWPDAPYFIPRPRGWAGAFDRVERSNAPSSHGRSLTMNTCWVGACEGDGIRVKESSWIEVHNVFVAGTGGAGIRVEDSACISFRHSHARDAGGAGVRIDGSSLCTLAHVYVPRSGGGGIRAEDSADLSVVACTVEQPGGDGIVLVDCDDAELVANTVRSTGWTDCDDDEGSGDGWDECDDAEEDDDAESSGGDPAKGPRRVRRRRAVAAVVWNCAAARVLRNRVTGLAGDGIVVRASGARIEGNHAERLHGTGVRAAGRSLTTSGNTVRRARGDGLRVTGEAAAVRGNSVTSVRGTALVVSSAGVGAAPAVESNVIDRPAGSGVLVTGSRDVAVTGNVVTRSGRDAFEIRSTEGVRIEGNAARRTRRFDLKVDGETHGVAIGTNELARLSRAAAAAAGAGTR